MKKPASICKLIAIVCLLNSSVVLAEDTLFTRLKKASQIEAEKDRLVRKEIASSSLMEAVEKDSRTFSELSPEMRNALFKQHPLRMMKVMGQRTMLTTEVSLLAVCKSMSYNGLNYLFALVEDKKEHDEKKDAEQGTEDTQE